MVRNGIWLIDSLTGSGTLTMNAGTLSIDSASLIGALALNSGIVGGPGAMVAGTLVWNGGSLGSINAPGGSTSVTGFASLIANGHSVNYAHTLNLNGGGTLAGNGQLFIGGFGVANATPYGSSAVNLAAGQTLTVQGLDSTSALIYGGGTFSNAGTFSKVSGSNVLYIDSGFVNAGVVNAQVGEIQFRNTRSLGGVVNVASGASLQLNGETTLASGLVVNSAGSVVLNGAYNVLTSGTLHLTGGGSNTLAGGALGGAGTVVFDNLAWNGGSLGHSSSLGGQAKVNGPATLSSNSHSVNFGYGLELNGNTSWGNSGQLFIEGPGVYNNSPYAGSSVTVGTGATLSVLGGPSTSFQIYGGGTLVNAGTINKASGTGVLYIDSALRNTGVLRADVGSIQLRGTVNNLGELHANGARIDITDASGLQQWNSATQTLTGGTYRVTGAEPIALNLGYRPGTAQASLIVNNNANIYLEGAGAALLTSATTPQANALGALETNRGVLSLTGGAQLKLTMGLNLTNTQGGVVAVGDASVLSATAYQQTSAASSTFIAGTVEAGTFNLSGGTLSAGASPGGVGTGLIDSLGVSFGAGAQFDEDLTAGQWDVLSIRTGNVTLAGTLKASFSGVVAAGTYRFLTTDLGSVVGTFDNVLSNLAPSAYSVSAIYGANYVDLSVTAIPVPEPQTLALWAVGLAWLGRRTWKTVSHNRFS